MTERPIIFSAPMVRAILAGTKTQTRRVVKLKPWHQIEERDDGSPWPWMYDDDRTADHWVPCPYGQPGDRLWVREAWGFEKRTEDDPLLELVATYRADDAEHIFPVNRWRPSIHMPRHLSRITLEVTAVRVERLRDISASDCLAEGIGQPLGRSEIWTPTLKAAAVHDYSVLWQSIHGTGSWDDNPWVWVVEFKRLAQS